MKKIYVAHYIEGTYRSIYWHDREYMLVWGMNHNASQLSIASVVIKNQFICDKFPLEEEE